LDRAGRILATNPAWDGFARQNGREDPRSFAVGTNYLALCRDAAEQGDDDARAALTGIEAVLRGSIPTFTMAYLTHAPDAQRWFELSATALTGVRGGAVVSHTDITERKRAE